MKDLSPQVEPLDDSINPLPQVQGFQLVKAPQEAITAVDSTAFSSGTGGNLSDSSITTLDNMRTRIGDIEAVLKALNLLK